LKARNAILLSLVAAGLGVACTLAASGDPAVAEVRNAQPSLDLFEFKVETSASTTLPATQPSGPEMCSQNIRICGDNGVPVPGVLVEWFQRYGEVFVLKDSCRTSAEGMCSVTVEVGANGKLQVTQQLSRAVRFVRRTPAGEIGPCTSGIAE
jgi:hypothetical protein